MKNSYLILYLSILVSLEGYFLLSFFNVDKIIYSSLINNYNEVQIKEYLDLKEKWNYFSYLLVPLLIIIKTSIIATTLYIGIFFSNNVIEFNKFWNIVLKAEFIFLLVPVFKIIWFYFFQTNYNLEDIQNFYPLSALNIVGYKDLETWFIYPFQTLNLFELAYIIYLGYQVGKLTNTNTDHGLKIVAYSYVPALLLWVVTIMFFTLNYS